MDSVLDCLTRLRVGKHNGNSAPNKPCLLLALICEIQSGHVNSPQVLVDTRLIVRYCDLYEIATSKRRKANPWLPLWHLRSDRGPSSALWQPDYHPTIRSIVKQLGQPKSMKDIEERFSTANLNGELFTLLEDPVVALEAASVMIGCYLTNLEPSRQDRLHEYMTAAFASGEYEKHPEQLAGSIQESPQQYARSAAFRSLVLDAYDYRCAASRRRFITPDFRYLVEAAHLIPFAASRDDRPCNGLALTPDLHWAMDNHLIAPGPDRNWHVSPIVDALMEDNQWLWRLEKQPLVLPREERFHPLNDGLAWRMDHLQR